MQPEQPDLNQAPGQIPQPQVPPAPEPQPQPQFQPQPQPQPQVPPAPQFPPQPAPQPELQVPPAPQPVPQPQFQPQPPMPTQSPQVTSVVPGKTMGIVGFIFAFVGLQLPGLVLCIMSLVKAKKAGQKNTLALVGIILNVVFGIIVSLILIGMTLTAYNGITAKANSALQQATPTSSSASE